VAIANALQLEAARRRACFGPNLYCACAQTAILHQLPLKVLTSPLDSARPRFPKEEH